MTSLLDPTGEEAVERRVIAEEPRPGSWFGDDDSDGRMLTQEETDLLIRAELHAMVPGTEPAAAAELRSILGTVQHVGLSFDGHDGPRHRATRQRGGIDSDPLVRLLAFRAWGDRDRRWFEDRGVRNGERVAMIYDGSTRIGARRSGADIALARPGDRVIGIALGDGHPGSAVKVEIDAAAVVGMGIEPLIGAQPSGRGPLRWTLHVSGRLRVEPRATGREALRDEGSPAYEQSLAAAYRFDRLQIEYDPTCGHTMMTAVRDGRRVQVRIDKSELRRVGSAAVWRRYLSALICELDRSA